MDYAKVFLKLFQMLESLFKTYKQYEHKKDVEKVKKNPGKAWNDKFAAKSEEKDNDNP